MYDVKVWVRIKLKTLAAARMALQVLGMLTHDQARVAQGDEKKTKLRKEADDYMAAEDDLRDADMKMQDKGGEKPK